jgi:hypothetical protein
MKRPSEVTTLHSRILKCALAAEEARAYWHHVDPSSPDRAIAEPSAEQAFEQAWFGAKSLGWVKELMSSFELRFANFPKALRVLHGWHDMSPVVRTLICHWHLQLADPLYRAFTGDFLPSRRDSGRLALNRSVVIAWVAEHGRPTWTPATHTQLASKLLTTARLAGLVSGRRDPRELRLPRVLDDALTYLLYVLRDVTIRGTVLDNPYLRSVGLEGRFLESRLARLAALDYRRTADVVEPGWRYPDVTAWAAAELDAGGSHRGGIAS